MRRRERAGMRGLLSRHPLRAAVAAIIGIALAIVVVSLTVGVRVVRVEGDSMSPGLGPGSRALVVPKGEIERGDVVVFDPPTAWYDAYENHTAGDDTKPHRRMVKRVIGLAGDRIECCSTDGRLIRNGQPFEEPYVDPSGSVTAFRVTVPADSIWLMGDNRSASFDSSDVQAWSGDGSVDTARVRGRIAFSW